MNRELEEVWKPIEGFEGFYVISRDGDIKSVERWIHLKSHSYIKKEQDIIQSINPSGYKQVKLYNNTGKTKSIVVHRLIAFTFLENPNEYKYINHIDGNKLNNNLSNLQWCTSSQNNTHAYRTGLKKPENYAGEACYFAKLTEKEVIAIREEYKLNKPFQRRLAEKYNTTITNINMIINRNTWKHV